mgnify:CR=1 FL=1
MSRDYENSYNRKIINLGEGLDFNTKLRYLNAVSALANTTNLFIERLNEEVASNGNKKLSDEIGMVTNACNNFKSKITNHGTTFLNDSDFNRVNQLSEQDTSEINVVVNRLIKTNQLINTNIDEQKLKDLLKFTAQRFNETSSLIGSTDNKKSSVRSL